MEELFVDDVVAVVVVVVVVTIWLMLRFCVATNRVSNHVNGLLKSLIDYTLSER